MLEYGVRYRTKRNIIVSVIDDKFVVDDKKDLIVSVLDDKKQELITQDAPIIPAGSVFTCGDRLEWDPYSKELKRQSLNPDFYEITLETAIPHPGTPVCVVQADTLERDSEELSNDKSST